MQVMNRPTVTDAANEQPIPARLAGQLAGWSAKARQYPVFSRTWFVYRARSFLLPVLSFTVFLLVLSSLIPSVYSKPAELLALFAVWPLVVVALFLGRWLAVLVCQRGWPPRRELAGVLVGLLVGVLVAGYISQFTRVQNSPSERLINGIVWAFVLLWLGGMGDLIAYLRQRRRLQDAHLFDQMERYKDERNQVAMRLSLLASQVEPHFLFNTLSGVRAAIISDPARGVAIIDHLVDYLRATIPQIRDDGAQLLVPLTSQLDAVSAYLGVIHTRLPRLAFRVDCPDELRHCAVPPLMLISLVENAVKHGIEPKKGPVEIVVSVSRRDQQLVLAVADDGVGFGGGVSGSGIGLSNIRERLQHLYQGQAALMLTAREQGGLQASISLPVQALPTKES
jgi:anti-sigma regulatory factor (Ser/Thr protein kinase)